MEEIIEKKPKWSKFSIFLFIVLFGCVIIVDVFISPEAVDSVLPLWYRLLNWTIDLIWVIVAYFTTRAYYKSLNVKKTFETEEEIDKYYATTKEGKKNKRMIITSLICAIIFIAFIIAINVLHIKGILASVGNFCDYIAFIATALFAIGLGEKAGIRKALKTSKK